MEKILHRAETRGIASHGWLVSRHTFSFANYYNPERMHFGALRVLNDDFVLPAMGFGTHPHDNMEIISIPLEGVLEHKDSMNNVTEIPAGEIQVMSAGSGITHSEYNKSKDVPAVFLQIWVFPNKRNVTPRYGLFSLETIDLRNKMEIIVSPEHEGKGVWIHQDAWFSLGELDKGCELSYSLHKEGHGVYAFVIEGSVSVQDELLRKRDGLGLMGVSTVSIRAEENARLLLMEVPLA